jgi:hypothetical protein
VVEVIEERVDELAAPGAEQRFQEAVLRYSRDVAFGAAEVYARRRGDPRRLGTPGWRPWWSTHCCAERRTTGSGPARRRWAGPATSR